MKLAHHKLWIPLAVAGVVGLSSLGTSTGCDDGGGAGGSDACAEEQDETGCFNYECFEAPAEEVSFQADVLPIFEQSCALSTSCHGGTKNSPMEALRYQPYLGEVDQEATPSDVPFILDAIVDKLSPTSALRIVAPGSPENSFLMHKMDGDLSCADLDCVDGDCGDSMPQASSALPRETRDVVRTWIAQGAQDN